MGDHNLDANSNYHSKSAFSHAESRKFSHITKKEKPDKYKIGDHASYGLTNSKLEKENSLNAD